MISGTGPANVLFKSGASTTIGRVRAGFDGAGTSFPGSRESPAFETAAGEALVINTPASVDAVGHLSYVLV